MSIVNGHILVHATVTYRGQKYERNVHYVGKPSKAHEFAAKMLRDSYCIPSNIQVTTSTVRTIPAQVGDSVRGGTLISL